MESGEQKMFTLREKKKKQKTTTKKLLILTHIL
jgi:hypothetical protein